MTRRTLTISAAACRRFLVHALELGEPHALPDVRTALDRLEFIQMDSINVCGRMHDLILWSRVRDYQPDQLTRFLYGERAAFEHYFPNLAVLPLRDYPYFLAHMSRRNAESPWRRVEEGEERAYADALLERIRAAGPLSGRELEDGQYAVNGWGTRARRATHLMDRLYLRGELGIASRIGFDRRYDLAERLFPVVAPHPDEEARAYLALKRMRAQRLFKLKPAERAILPEGLVVPVKSEGLPPGYHVLAEDAARLEQVEARLEQADALPVSDEVSIIAPLDPLVYDRVRTRQLFDFDYTWEVYTPQAKRRWGYYVLPLLQGDRLIGRIDAKIDRRAGRLLLFTLALEPGIDVEPVAAPLARRLAAFARWLGAGKVSATKVEPPALRRLLKVAGLPLVTTAGDVT